MIKRRLDTSYRCDTTAACPAVFELDNGDFAIIGTASTKTIKPVFPEGSGCAQHEEIITVPKAVFREAVASYTGK